MMTGARNQNPINLINSNQNRNLKQIDLVPMVTPKTMKKTTKMTRLEAVFIWRTRPRIKRQIKRRMG